MRRWLRSIFHHTPPKLAPGEVVLLTIHMHWLSFIARITPMVSLSVITTLVATLSPVNVILVWAVQYSVIVYLLSALAIAHALMIFYRIMEWRASTLCITTTRVIRGSGIFTFTGSSMNRRKLTDVLHRKPLVGRLFNYGTIRFETSGQLPVQVIKFVPAPETVYRAILGDVGDATAT